MVFSCIRLFIWLTLLTGAVYPLLVTAISFGEKSNGGFIYKEGKAIGSSLIGQNFSDLRYFWPRPSAIDYNPLSSGGSNLSLTSALLKKQVEERVERLLKAHPYAKRQDIPDELLFASGSGLDPHISKKAAQFQMERVMRARGWSGKISREIIEGLIDKSEENLFFEHPYVNVLKLNISLDSLPNLMHESKEPE